MTQHAASSPMPEERLRQGKSFLASWEAAEAEWVSTGRRHLGLAANVNATRHRFEEWLKSNGKDLLAEVLRLRAAEPGAEADEGEPDPVVLCPKCHHEHYEVGSDTPPPYGLSGKCIWADCLCTENADPDAPKALRAAPGLTQEQWPLAFWVTTPRNGRPGYSIVEWMADRAEKVYDDKAAAEHLRGIAKALLGTDAATVAQGEN